jgi:hypothetical protein
MFHRTSTRTLVLELGCMIQNLIHEVEKLSTTIVTRDQFDAALSSAVTTISTAIADLEAKIAAGGVTTPEDFSAELATLQGVVATAVAGDPGPQAPAPAPSTPAAS